MDHIYNCELLSGGKEKLLNFKRIYNGTMGEQVEVFRIFENNMQRRKKLKNNSSSPCDLSKDPLSPMAAMG